MPCPADTGTPAAPVSTPRHPQGHAAGCVPARETGTAETPKRRRNHSVLALPKRAVYKSSCWDSPGQVSHQTKAMTSRPTTYRAQALAFSWRDTFCPASLLAISYLHATGLLATSSRAWKIRAREGAATSPRPAAGGILQYASCNKQYEIRMV